MPISSNHLSLFHQATASDKMTLFQSLLDSGDLSADEALALLTTIHTELEQARGDRGGYVHYAEMMESLHRQMPDVYEQVTSRWQSLHSGLMRPGTREIHQEDSIAAETKQASRQKGIADYGDEVTKMKEEREVEAVKTRDGMKVAVAETEEGGEAESGEAEGPEGEEEEIETEKPRGGKGEEEESEEKDEKEPEEEEKGEEKEEGKEKDEEESEEKEKEEGEEKEEEESKEETEEEEKEKGEEKEEAEEEAEGEKGEGESEGVESEALEERKGGEESSAGEEKEEEMEWPELEEAGHQGETEEIETLAEEGGQAQVVDEEASGESEGGETGALG